MPSVKPLWKRQNGKCYFCDCDTHLRKLGNPMLPNTATVEHLYAKTNGGTNRPSNLRMSCHQCNSNKGNMSAVWWYVIVNDPKKLKAFRRASIIRKRLSKMRKLRRRIAKLTIKYGADCTFVTTHKQTFMNLARISA